MVPPEVKASKPSPPGGVEEAEGAHPPPQLIDVEAPEPFDGAEGVVEGGGSGQVVLLGQPLEGG